MKGTFADYRVKALKLTGKGLQHMNIKITGCIAAAICTTFALAGSTVQASTVTYYLDQSNVTQLPDGVVDYLSVTITDGVTFGSDTNAVRFDVKILPAMPVSSGGSYGIDKFGFNSNLSMTDGLVVGQPSSWTGNAAPPPNQLDGFGKFVVAVDGTGSSRQDPTLTFYVSGVSGDTIANYAFPSTGTAGEGNTYFAAHVGGFNACAPGGGCATSAYFGGGSIIPVPAAVWLMGSAVGLLGWVRQKTV